MRKAGCTFSEYIAILSGDTSTKNQTGKESGGDGKFENSTLLEVSRSKYQLEKTFCMKNKYDRYF